ncbi:MAG: hypothetical protein IIB76_10085 [Proteobacteria bacterium]|nr:hypothetical protein [Pseudomonadota bacterium]
MYVAIVQMDIPEPDHDAMVKLSLSSTPKFVAAKANGLLTKYNVSGSAGVGGVYIWKTREDAEAWYTPGSGTLGGDRASGDATAPRLALL